MVSPTKPVLEGFMALRDNASRRAVINGILDSLSSYEIREVKSRLESMTFQCDLLDRLPLELVAMIVEYLELDDILLLRKVSKRWHELLSSTMVVTTAIRYHMGENGFKSNSSAGLDALIKKRIRAERGLPAVMVTIPNNLPRTLENDLNRDGISFFNGVCVWIEESTDRTTIFVIHLPTGENRLLTTENREEFTHVEVSDTLVSATSVRGYCHVWKLFTEQYKSFRIPSLQFAHYISIGSKVVLGYVDSVVHFCFDSGVARSIKLGQAIVLLSVHAEEDAFTVVSVRGKYTNNFQPQNNSFTLGNDHHLKTQKFSVDENKFICTWERYRELPFRPKESWQLRYEPEATIAYRESLHPGQSSALLFGGIDQPYDMLSLSLEADDQITVHFHFRDLDSERQHANLDYSARGPGLTYRREDCGRSRKIEMEIGYETPELTHVLDAKGRRFTSKQTVEVPEDWSGTTTILGDGDFVIFPSDDEILIWCFDETWVPSSVLEAWVL